MKNSIQEFQHMLALLVSPNDRTVARRVGLNNLPLHGLQESKRMLPFGAFLTCTDCCTVADSAHSRPRLALFQQL